MLGVVFAPSCPLAITTSSRLSGATSPTKNKRSGVHPSTDFDLPSHSSTPIPSDTEADARDLHRAQQIAMIFSTITSTLDTQCVVKTILRREYESIVKEAAEGNKGLRKYLVATDLSGEAQHVLGLTITVEKQNCPHNQITRVILEKWAKQNLSIVNLHHKPHYRTLPSCDKGYKKNKNTKVPLHNHQHHPDPTHAAHREPTTDSRA